MHVYNNKSGVLTSLSLNYKLTSHVAASRLHCLQQNAFDKSFHDKSWCAEYRYKIYLWAVDHYKHFWMTI